MGSHHGNGFVASAARAAILRAMRSVLARIPFRESRAFIVACLVVFIGLLTARLAIEKPVKEEKSIAKRKAEGKVIAPEAYIPVWLYKGLQANLIVAGALLLASPWLGWRRTPGMCMAEAPARTPLARWEVVACAALMGVAAWHNSPRLFHSMWGDEEFNASRFMLDEVEREADGSIKIVPKPWATTLWNMRKPTNHLGYSVFARLTHDTFFHKGTGPSDPWFSEALLRAPVFAAGLLLIPAFLWALRVWGLRPWWGLLLLLLHPWFTRFGVDGRGYGFVLLGATLNLGVLGRALQTGKWHWWLLFGLGSFFIMWSNLQGIYPVGALNLVAMASLLTSGMDRNARWLLAGRWFVANMLTLMLVVGYLAPCWPQLQEFMAKGEIQGDLDWRFWKDGLCAFLFGQPLHPWDEPGNPLLHAMEISMQTLPWLHLTGIGLLTALIGAGVGALWRSPQQRVLLLFTLGAPVLMLVHMSLGGNRPYDWYFCPFLPGLFAMAAAGAERFAAGRTIKALRGAGLTTVVLLYAFVTWDPRQLLRQHPIEPSRESVALYRKITTPRNPDIEKEVMSGGFAMYTEGYDPALRRFRTVEELQALLAEADRTQRRFYVNVGYMRFIRSTQPGISAMLDDPAIFEHAGHFPGLLPYTSRDVFRYRGKIP